MITVKNIENLLMQVDVLEAVAQRCYAKKMFLEMSKNSQENTCDRVSVLTLAQMFSCEFCKISKNTFSYRTPKVAASAKAFCKIYNKIPVRPSLLNKDNVTTEAVVWRCSVKKLFLKIFAKFTEKKHLCFRGSF